MHHVIIPQDDLLRKHILSFNTLIEFDSNIPLSYYAFPQRGITMGFFKKSDITFIRNEIVISRNPFAKPKALLLGKYLGPLKITYQCHVEKISIHFDETGVNQFFENYFTCFAKNIIQIVELTVLKLDPVKLFSSLTFDRIAYLEEYLLRNFNPSTINHIEKVISMIWEFPSIPLCDLANHNFTTERTINRWCHKYVGCSISDFKRIVKFRKTTSQSFKDTEQRLTDLCLDNGYFDSSHFYKHIKQTTGFNPKYFFQNVKKFGLENHIYIKQ